VFLNSYFLAAFLVVIVLLILDAGAPPVVGQARTVTVTVYVPTVRTIYASTVQTIYLPEYRTILQTVTVSTTQSFTQFQTILSTTTQVTTSTDKAFADLSKIAAAKDTEKLDEAVASLIGTAVAGFISGAAAVYLTKRQRAR
jgi:carbohydrate-binding DOMON domain-containing protein